MDNVQEFWIKEVAAMAVHYAVNMCREQERLHLAPFAAVCAVTCCLAGAILSCRLALTLM